MTARELRRLFAAAGVALLMAEVLSAAPKLFPPLRNETPIAVFASKAKAVVTEQGAVQVLEYWNQPQGYSRERKEGVLLRVGVADHAIATAETSQRYTGDAAPVVETVFRWPDAKLTLRAFAGEPEASGFYVIAELASTASVQKQFVMEVDLANVRARLSDRSAAIDETGRTVMRIVSAGRGDKPAAAQPRAVWLGGTPGVAALDVPVTLAPSAKSTLAIELPFEGNGLPDSAAEALAAANSMWEGRFAGTMRIALPDERLQAAWDANLKQLGMMLEPQLNGLRILKGLGRYHGSNPYDTLQGSLILDRLGHTDLTEAILRRQLKRMRADGIFEMWEEAVPPTRVPDQWIVQGLATFGMWKHYEITKDRRWLEEIAPVVLRAAKATSRARRKPTANGTQNGIAIKGFVPPGFGDGGIPNGYTLPQNFGPLTGLWVARQVAEVLDMPEKAWLEKEYQEYRQNILDVMRAATVKNGEFAVVPSFPGAGPEHRFKHLWGTVEGVYPFAQVAVDDPLVLGTLRFLQHNQKEGLHLNLGYSEGVWPYMSASLAHWHMRLGEYDEAFRIQQAILDHASPTWGWYEELEHNPPKGHADIPDVWGTCELLHVTRELLLMEKDDTLLLAAGAPSSWAQAGRKLSVEAAPSLFGVVSYECNWTANGAEAKVRLNGDTQPKSVRIRLLPEGVKAIMKVSGATFQSSEGRFVNLANPGREIVIRASW